jgi:hypothetical protein
MLLVRRLHVVHKKFAYTDQEMVGEVECAQFNALAYRIYSG